jgi:hypothetical protein
MPDDPPKVEPIFFFSRLGLYVFIGFADYKGLYLKV